MSTIPGAKVRERKKRTQKRLRARKNKRSQDLIATKGRGFAKMAEMVDVVERDTAISRERLERIINEQKEQPGSEEGTPNEEAVS